MASIPNNTIKFLRLSANNLKTVTTSRRIVSNEPNLNSSIKTAPCSQALTLINEQQKQQRSKQSEYLNKTQYEANKFNLELKKRKDKNFVNLVKNNLDYKINTEKKSNNNLINSLLMGSSNSKCPSLNDKQHANCMSNNHNNCSNNWDVCDKTHFHQPINRESLCQAVILNNALLNNHQLMCACSLNECLRRNCGELAHRNKNTCCLATVASNTCNKLNKQNLNSVLDADLPNVNHSSSTSNQSEPYWLQYYQAEKLNKLNLKQNLKSEPSKLTIFSRNLLGTGNMSNNSNMANSNNEIQKRNYHSHVINGMDLLREPNLNKDLAYTAREREKYGIKGLIPPAIRSQELQAKIAIEQFRKLDHNLTKYMYLRDLQDLNKRLFYRLLVEYVEELMPIVYTPVVGDACIKYSELYKRPRGLFITKHDLGSISDIFNNWPEKDIKAIVVTDGERILGLGDLGANGMGIPVGKLALYSALAAIPPHYTLPITLDVGTNNEKLINSEYYIGLKEPRERGPIYDNLLDEFMEAVVRKWGRSCLVQFEDFGNSNAFKLLEKYRNHYCTFNDDIQGTASVAVAGVLAACKRMKKKISQQKFLFMGAGGAALGISDLLVLAMEQEGLSVQEARDNIYLIDSKGLISLERQNEKDRHKMEYAKSLPNYHNLEKVVEIVKPTCLIGVCAQPGVFTPGVLRKMSEYNESPIIFPLSNPTSKAECTAEQAYIYTDGKAIFASGSPFDIVKYKNQTFIPGQGNNSYIFPGIALAVMSCAVHTIPEETFLVAARALADQVTPDDLNEGRVYPSLKKIQQVSVKIATKISQYFFVQGLSSIRPEPDDKEIFIRSHQYNYDYDH